MERGGKVRNEGIWAREDSTGRLKSKDFKGTS
jgi:hypothetical protein